MLLLVALASSVASAQRRPAQRRLGVGWNGHLPTVTFSAADLISASVRRKLQSGLPQTIVMRIFAYGEGSGDAFAVVPRSCRVAYDLWEEVYRVQIQTATTDRSVTVSSVEEVARRCLVARRVHVGARRDYSRLRQRQVFFAVLVELNPLSRDTVERIRRWLARPARVEGDAFFGSFVSLFVNRRIGDAERTIRFRSQPVRVP